MSVTADVHAPLILGVVAGVTAALLYWATFYFRAVDWTPLGLAFWPRTILVGIALTSLVLIALRQRGAHSRLRLLRPEIILFAAIASFVIAPPISGSCSRALTSATICVPEASALSSASGPPPLA